MMIAPPHSSGLAVVDLVVQSTRLRGQLLLTPLLWTAPAPALVAPAPSEPPTPAADAQPLAALAAADVPVTDHALLGPPPIVIKSFDAAPKNNASE